MPIKPSNLTVENLNLPYQRQLGNLLTCGQLEVSDLEKLAAAGFKTLILNRPDAEEAGQPEHLNLASAAKKLGLHWIYQPVISGAVTLEEGQEFGRLLAAAPEPALAFCRTGARCGCLWALSQVAHTPAAELIAQMQTAGFAMPDFFKFLASCDA